MTLKASAPAHGEVEVSIFGPRYGESIVVHVGDGSWIIVDSCDSPRGGPAPLEYLTRLGVDVTRKVALVVATHWHDDHVRGLAGTVEACTNARVFCSAALQFEEFLAVAEVYGRENPLLLQSKVPGGLREFRRVVEVLAPRTLELALASSRLWMAQHSAPVEVWALSPSQLELRLTQRILGREFGRLLDPIDPTGSLPASRIGSRRPNHAAVALWISVGDVELLLGSDLEEPGHAGLGWSAVVGSTTRPRGLAAFVKVPHHGSKTAHSDAMWTTMTAVTSVAGVTPFVRGRVALPTEADIARIRSLRPKLYATAPARAKTSDIRSSAVRKTVREATRRFEDRHPPFGQVRWRKLVGSAAEATVELDGAAFGC
jgi:beta-lactamase superfamily II metal-dependent hydrolase